MLGNGAVFWLSNYGVAFLQMHGFLPGYVLL